MRLESDFKDSAIVNLLSFPLESLESIVDCLVSSRTRVIQSESRSICDWKDSDWVGGCPGRFLQTSIFNVQPHAVKDPNSSANFVMGAAQFQGQDGGKVARVIVSHV